MFCQMLDSFKANSQDMFSIYISNAHEENIPSELGYTLLIFPYVKTTSNIICSIRMH